MRHTDESFVWKIQYRNSYDAVKNSFAVLDSTCERKIDSTLCFH